MMKEQKNIFGNKSKFAIEAILWQIDEEPIFINYCLWIRNNMVGDIGQCALLSAEMEPILKVVQLKGHRQMPFENLTAPVLTDKLIENTWGYASDYSHNVPLSNIDILSYHGECFQGYFVFLIEQQGYEWLLTKDNVDNKYYDMKIPSGIIYSTFKKFSKWIEDSTMLVLRTNNASITNG
ncbi:Imm42 family immunity protein [uncultured Bacteroides sp.]|uniref:Imm42 family immunity protein n=1 Tax=uncultured Bacteroides sp. TaxID=162156 RepID=UPI002616F492|nr:Imm42 family immunity protein [uncultured Bacteroides sp.]